MKRKSSSFLDEENDMAVLVHEMSGRPLPAGPADFWQRMQSFAPLEELQSNLRENFPCRMTTHFSGLGTAVVAANMIQMFLHTLGFLSPEEAIVFHSARDLGTTCQEVLEAHRRESKSDHMFGDVCRAAPSDVVRSLERRLRQLQAEFKQMSFKTNESKN